MLEKIEKRDNIITYERKYKHMAKNKKIKDSGNNGSDNHQNQKIPEGANFIYIILSIMVIILGAAVWIVQSVTRNEDDIKNIKDKLDELESLETRIDEIDDDLNDIDKNLKILTQTVNSKIASEDNSKSAVLVTFVNDYEVRLGFENMETLSPPPAKNTNETVAVSLEDDNIKFTQGALRNKWFMTVYTEDNNEIYFLGKFNENDCWDGDCVLNVYSNNELVSVFEGTYDNGTLKNYKRVSCDTEGQWTVMDRVSYKDENGKEYNTGETWVYKKNESVKQTINPEYFLNNEILRVDWILNNIDDDIIKYYKGKISNGAYNDESGDAVIVEYDENNKIRFFYKGKVKNGNPQDDSGSAWAIGWGDANDGYHYYQSALFENGNNKRESGTEVLVSQEEINRIISSENINCPLRWITDY